VREERGQAGGPARGEIGVEIDRRAQGGRLEADEIALADRFADFLAFFEAFDVVFEMPEADRRHRMSR